MENDLKRTSEYGSAYNWNFYSKTVDSYFIIAFQINILLVFFLSYQFRKLFSVAIWENLSGFFAFTSNYEYRIGKNCEYKNTVIQNFLFCFSSSVPTEFPRWLLEEE